MFFQPSLTLSSKTSFSVTCVRFIIPYDPFSSLAAFSWNGGKAIATHILFSFAEVEARLTLRFPIRNTLSSSLAGWLDGWLVGCSVLVGSLAAFFQHRSFILLPCQCSAFFFSVCVFFFVCSAVFFVTFYSRCLVFLYLSFTLRFTC